MFRAIRLVEKQKSNNNNFLFDLLQLCNTIKINNILLFLLLYLLYLVIIVDHILCEDNILLIVIGTIGV